MTPDPPEPSLQTERSRLRELDLERAAVLNRIAELEARFAAGSNPETGAPDISTADGRVELFASLFQGRPDLFATRWESRRQPGRSGWSPRCANEWVEGICEKPRVKCGDCAHRRFLPYSRAEIRAHLEGHQTVGIYPLLPDETCRLSAIDLDGDGWREDVSAVRDAADQAEIPVLVERSRSGDGAHLWVIFTGPVKARIARALGEYLLTEAMRSRELAISSYDRLFPNQDTMPAGGFGNLIALPLQRGPRHEGHTEFLDHALEPYPEQWTYLAGVESLEISRLEMIVQEAERTGQTLAVGRWDTDEQTVEQARLSPTPGADRASTGPVRATISDRIEINAAALSGELRARLRRTASFANPVFHEKQNARLSTYGTPRVIACHEARGDDLLLPRGCLEQIRKILDGVGLELGLEDTRIDGRPIDLTFNGTLRPEQERAVDSILNHEIGVLVAPPGAGKTVIGTALIARRAVSTLVLVHRRPLQAQWQDRIEEHLGIGRTEIGTLAAGAPPADSGVDVATVQTLTRRDRMPELLAGYGQILVDECHHVGAISIETLLRQAPARYVTGLTATPRRRDGHHPIVAMQCGPVRHTIETPSAGGTDARRVAIERRTGFDPAGLPNDPSFQEIISAIAADRERNELIVEDTLDAVTQRRFPIVLTERRTHLAALSELLAVGDVPVITLHGGMGAKARHRATELLASDRPRILVATGRYIGEGFDDPLLDTLVLALPVAWRGTVVQYAGRLHRDRKGKSEIRILDYVDHEVGVLRRMFKKRERAYRTMGYERADSVPPSDAPASWSF